MDNNTRMAPQQRRTLDRLKGVPGFDRFCLAGGGAVAIHLGHRESADIVLFSLTPDMDLDSFRRTILAYVTGCTVVSVTDASFRLLMDGVMVDVVCYPYAFTSPVEGPGGIPVASLEDLATMKLIAIARRGLRRDFWDLHVIVEAGMTLRHLGQVYRARFGVSEPDFYHVLRSLTYFVDAERDPVFPKGLTEEHWEAVKAFFRLKAAALIEEREP